VVGDDVGLTEELYVSMIGRYAAAVEVLTKRIQLKDQELVRLDAEIQGYKAVPQGSVAEVEFSRGLQKHVQEKYGMPIDEVTMEEINPYFVDNQGSQGTEGDAPGLIFQDVPGEEMPVIIGATSPKGGYSKEELDQFVKDLDKGDE
jgi:hypothetical protein